MAKLVLDGDRSPMDADAFYGAAEQVFAGRLRLLRLMRMDWDGYERSARFRETPWYWVGCLFEGRVPHHPAHQHDAHLVRDIFGNPFRPVTADPAWLTPTVVALAEAVYADRAFDRLPVLADAIEEAGCDNADVLAHCRGDGPHARGCWVVDLVLGKA